MRRQSVLRDRAALQQWCLRLRPHLLPLGVLALLGVAGLQRQRGNIVIRHPAFLVWSAVVAVALVAQLVPVLPPSNGDTTCTSGHSFERLCSGTALILTCQHQVSNALFTRT